MAKEVGGRHLIAKAMVQSHVGFVVDGLVRVKGVLRVFRFLSVEYHSNNAPYSFIYALPFLYRAFHNVLPNYKHL